MKKIMISLLVAIVFSTGCAKKRKNTNKSFKKDKITVFAEKVKPENLTEYIRISGKFEGIKDVTVISRNAGQLLKLNIELGDSVTAGDTLGLIDDRGLKYRLIQAKSSLKSAELSFKIAETNFKASEKLFEEEKISQTELDKSRMEAEIAKARAEGAKADLEQLTDLSESALIIAKISGYAADIPVKEGDMISVGAPLCRIVDSRKLIIRTGAGESELGALKKGLEAVVFTKSQSKCYYGTVKGFGIAKKAGTSSYPVEIEVKNDGNLFPGMIAEIKIKSAEHKNVIAVGMNALLKEFDKYYVFKIKNSDIVSRREITLGKEVEGRYIIDSGLEPDEIIVLEGIENMTDGEQVNVNLRNKN
ncbi:MAG: hypothetical protein CSB55_00785 [Candidatus Cloacimonadota bacterium]|nr:MAG: hypothetical protein CSB55_00785 [Candidatus Cloacimonadota bacterium]